MISHEFPVPETIPGKLVQNYDDLNNLKEHLATLCGTKNKRFPGSQPVSFTTQSIELLVNEDFWVCEKSDGVRVLILAVSGPSGPELYLIDRKEHFYLNQPFILPHHADPASLHSDTLLDGELVIDVDRETGEQHLHLLCFDCIVLDGVNLMKKPLSSRYGRLRDFIYNPYKAFMDANPEFSQQMPFQLVVKTMEKAYGIEAVFREHLPSLKHGNDGLIFTSAVGNYVVGTDQKILKWKPPSENSIDFRLELRFPPKANNASQPDYFAKPAFLLMMDCGHDPEWFFDFLHVEDEEWEEMKESGEQFDNRIVEVVWNPEVKGFRLMRFRDDKKGGNYREVVFTIINSIKDGVEADQLIANASRIKGGWRQREAQAKAERERQAAEIAARKAAAEASGQVRGEAGHSQPQSAPTQFRPAAPTRTLRL